METSKEETMGQKPSHKLFFVQPINKTSDAGEEKSFWRQIGVAWEHKS